MHGIVLGLGGRIEVDSKVGSGSRLKAVVPRLGSGAYPALDVLLTDLMLPWVSGAELAVGLKDRWPSLRVVLMSGYTEDEAVRRGVRTGEVRFFKKPFDIATLAREIGAALDG